MRHSGARAAAWLDPRELTGALEPLRDIEFFNGVYVDARAPAWPSDIDLAPDAIYRQIAGGRDTREPRILN